MLAIRTGLSGPKFDGIDERDLSSSDPTVRLVCAARVGYKRNESRTLQKSCDVLKRPARRLTGKVPGHFWIHFRNDSVTRSLIRQVIYYDSVVLYLFDKYD